MIANWRTLAIAIFLLLTSGASWWFLRILKGPTDTLRTTAVKQEQVDYYMENFRATFMDADGQRKYVLKAELMQHYPYSHKLRLIKPIFVQFKAGRQAVNSRGDVGWYYSTNKEIILSGNVKIVQVGEAVSEVSETTTTELRVLLK
jgi:LPS export ABC transporter protein LptC